MTNSFKIQLSYRTSTNKNYNKSGSRKAIRVGKILKLKYMSKLSLEALKNRAEAIASNELLSSISGGTEDTCHDTTPPPPPPPEDPTCDDCQTNGLAPWVNGYIHIFGGHQ